MSQIEVSISIGERTFEVACQEGEQQYLQAAAKMLDTEAQVLVSSIGRMPESRLLLMSGLMLADKTAVLEERVKEAEDVIAGLQDEIAALKAAPKPEPKTVEVPVIPDSIAENLAELAARAEALAAAVTEKVGVDPAVNNASGDA